MHFDKYEMYLRSVQNPVATLATLNHEYRRRFKSVPRSLAEDFCGTFALSCAWVEQKADRTAIAVDIDEEPLRYGVENFVGLLSESQRARLRVFQTDVRYPKLPKTDVIAALNFSYFTFQTRKDLKAYFVRCYRRLNSGGLLFLDAFGGAQTQKPSRKELRYPGFTYYWEQVSFDPLTQRAEYFIHYRRKGEALRKRVFHYDWRMWTLPEISELLEEVGFERPRIIQSKDSDGEGWFAYLAAAKL